MKVGIIDIGSNTFNLFIAEIEDRGNYTPLYRSKVPVKLGEGSFEKNYITEEAMQRAMIALDAQMTAIKNQYCDMVLAFATSAVRNASNGTLFVQRVKERFGINIHVIDGEREAHLIYMGTKLANALGTSKSLIMDIGGGSTEFIIADQEQVYWKKSYELGVTRLMEKFRPSDPISKDEKLQITGFLGERLAEVFEASKKHEIRHLVGSSGSFDTFSDVLAHRDGQNGEVAEFKSHPFNFDNLRQLLEELTVSTLAQRERMPGMVDFRVKMIGMSALMVLVVLHHTEVAQASLSRYSLKEGALFEVLNGNL